MDKVTSDKLTVRFPPGLLDELRMLAQEDDRSLNREIISFLRDAVEQRKKRGKQKQ